MNSHYWRAKGTNPEHSNPTLDLDKAITDAESNLTNYCAHRFGSGHSFQFYPAQKSALIRLFNEKDISKFDSRALAQRIEDAVLGGPCDIGLGKYMPGLASYLPKPSDFFESPFPKPSDFKDIFSGPITPDSTKRIAINRERFKVICKAIGEGLTKKVELPSL